MILKFNEFEKGSLNGVDVTLFEKGKVYNIPEPLAKQLLLRGSCEEICLELNMDFKVTLPVIEKRIVKKEMSSILDKIKKKIKL